MSRYCIAFVLIILPIGGCASAGGSANTEATTDGAGTGISEPDVGITDDDINTTDTTGPETEDAGPSDGGTGEEEVELPPVTTLPEEVPRKLLHEVFSGSNCKPCKQADADITNLLEENPGLFTILKYQIGSDPYVSNEGVKRRMYYLPGKSTYDIPYVHADGVHGFHPLKANNDQGYLQSDFQNWQSLPSKMILQVVSTRDGQSVEFDVGITPLADYAAGLVLHAAIFESVTYNNVGINEQTEFHYVMKKMVPNHFGTQLGELVRGESQAFTLSHTFAGDYTSETGMKNMVNHATEHTVEDFANLYVIVWVQEPTGWMVEQSAWAYPNE